MRNEVEEDGEATRVPVEGVELTVVGPDGAEVGTVTTDAEGRYEIPLPGPGDYTVHLDKATLPDDVELRDEAQASRSSTSARPSARSSTTSSARTCARPRAGGPSSPRRSPTASSSA